MKPILIVGGGHGAAQAISTLKMLKYDGPITLISDEPVLPYQRPPLSKAYLMGDLTAERLPIVRQKVYDDLGVDVRLETRVASIDADAHHVITDTGDVIEYAKLILTTGGLPRPAPIMVGASAALQNKVFEIRTKADADRLKEALPTFEHVGVIGGGFIGLEAAAVMRKLGKSVTLFEIADRLLGRVTCPEVSTFFADMHRAEGVDLKLGTGVASFAVDGDHVLIEDDQGDVTRVDVIIMGIGMVPASMIALDAGLEGDLRSGLLTDRGCRTSNPDIFAAGDCTLHDNGFYERIMRLESVQNAVDQAKVAAQNAVFDMRGEASVDYRALPWFWSDQYDVKLQIAGVSQGYDQVVLRGNPSEGRSFAAFFLKNDRLIAVDCINMLGAYTQGRKMIEAGAKPDPSLLSDASNDLKAVTKELLEQQAS